MRKLSAIVIIVALILLTGCQSNNTLSETSSPTTAPNIPVDTTVTTLESIDQAQMFAVVMPVTTVSTTADDGNVLMNYNYQSMSLIVPEPELADKIIVDYLTRIDAIQANADSLLSQAKTNYTASANWIPYGCSVSYNTTRIDQSVLSLVGTNITYSGGSHPNYDCISANYDMITGEVLTLGSILTHENTVKALQQAVVEALNEVKEEKYLYSGYEKTVEQRFSADISFDEDWYFSSGGLCFYFSPYDIAPYSSGEIHVEIPYSALVGILADPFFPPEQETVDGTLTVQRFEDATLSNFSQIAEVLLDKESQKLFIYTDTSVDSIRIIQTDPLSGRETTICAVDCLTPGDAIMLEAADETLACLELRYDSNGQTVTAEIIP